MDDLNIPAAADDTQKPTEATPAVTPAPTEPAA